jgi:hypothetical protein
MEQKRKVVIVTGGAGAEGMIYKLRRRCGMRKCLGAVVGVAMLFIFIGTSMAVESELPDAMAIVKKMQQVFEPSRPTVRKVVITNTDNKGRTEQLVTGRAWKNFPEGKKMLLVILEPKSVRGKALLVWERTGGKQESSYFAYYPSVKRVRQLRGVVEPYENFMNTQFTYSDLGFVPVDKRYTLLGTEDRNGVRAYKIEEKVAKEQKLYSRIILWVAVDSSLPVERDYYDKSNRLWKTELFKEVTIYDGVPVPRIIEMKDVLNNFKTELKIVMMSQETNISDEIFNPNLLEKASEASVWKLFGSETSK